MKITATQLRRIISEEFARTLSETADDHRKLWKVTYGEGDMGGSFSLGTVEAPNERAAHIEAKKKFGKSYEVGYTRVELMSAPARRYFAARQAQEAEGDLAAAKRGAAVKKDLAAVGPGKLWLASTDNGAGIISYLGIVSAPNPTAADAAAARKWGAEYTGVGGIVEPTTKAKVAALIDRGRF